MKINDFLIKKNTGYVYQISKIKDNQIEFVKLGDSQSLSASISEVEMSFTYLPFLSTEGRKIITLRQDLTNDNRDQYVVYDKNQGTFAVASSFDLDDTTFNELKKNLENLDSNHDKVKYENDRLKREIEMFRTKGGKVKRIGLFPESANTIRDSLDIEQDKKRQTANLKSEDESPSEFIILEPAHSDTLDNIILAPVTREKIDEALVKYEFGSFIDEYLANDTVKSNSGALVLNFYGPPGTGKTISAKAFANKVGKKILSVDFAQLISKMVGDTGKNIQKYFQKAREDNLILLFDEADTLIQKRSSEGDVHSHYANQNQNIFMRELDKFDGIVILTTNLFENYDPALLRRITNIEYPLPTAEMREAIIEKHMSKNARYGLNVSPSKLSELTDGFSGGDIKNLMKDVGLKNVNRIRKQNENKTVDEVKEIISNSVIPLDYFMEEVENIKKNKANYLKIKAENRNKIGLGFNPAPLKSA